MSGKSGKENDVCQQTLTNDRRLASHTEDEEEMEVTNAEDDGWGKVLLAKKQSYENTPNDGK